MSRNRRAFWCLGALLACLSSSAGGADAAMAVPAELELLREQILDSLQSGTRGFLDWHQLRASGAQVSTSEERTQAALADADRWLRLTLRPQWVPERLHPFALCFAKAVPGLAPTPGEPPTKYDAVSIRYAAGGTTFQIVQTSYLMGVVIAPAAAPWDSLAGRTDLETARWVVNAYLQEPQEITRVSLQRCTCADGVTRGEPKPTAADWFSNQWYDTVYWYMDQQSFAFTCWKVRGGPALEGPRLPDWFK